MRSSGVNRHFVTLLAGLLAIGFGGGASAVERDAETLTDAESAWTLGASAYFYFIASDRDYVQPTIIGDRRWLHLEARYNYEDLDTGSGWVGYNFSVGGEVSLDFTPKLGIVFGQTTGIAPGFNGTLGWKSFVLYSEGEHVFDSEDDENSFYYSWSELTASSERMRGGLALQRTQVYETPREFQWGALLGASFGGVEIGAYVFDPDHEDRTYVISVSADVPRQ